LPQKTFRIYARNEYSDRSVFYPLTDGGLSRYRRFLLRNSGNDWASTMMRDALMQSLMEGTGLDRQGYRPAVVYLNGKYWGIHNIRERFDRHYLEAAHKVDPDNVDILETNADLPYHVEVVEGSSSHYRHMIDFIESHDISDEQNYAMLADLIDVANFADYQISQIYYGNYDWPANNSEFWRENLNAGKWRSFLYDTDFGFMLYRERQDQGINWENDYTHNTLEYAATASGPFDYPYHRNPSWATLIFHELLSNEEFEIRFITRFSDYLNTRFHSEHVSKRISDMAVTLQPEIPFHAQRWGGRDGGGGLVSFQTEAEWESNVEVLHEFARHRPQHVFEHLKSQFDLSGLTDVTIDVSNVQQGYVKLNSLAIREETAGISANPYPWEGTYFQGLPAQVVARPYPGYRLAFWEGADGHSSGSD
ncbi:MAG: CotH kinase family protein, partial [Balneolales bacterium]